MVYLYKNKKPELNDIVLAKIIDINNLNIVASLIDYDNLTAYISYAELSRKKRYKLHKIVTVGKEVITQITGFNNKKNYAELSIRALNDTDIEEFTNFRKKYQNLYNLWRYVFMKLNPELNMDINKIDNDKINIFMENTLWLLEEYFNEKEEEFNLEEIYKNLINSEMNHLLLEKITNYDPIEIKKILDTYSSIKVIPVKQTKNHEFTAYSYELDGLQNIKNAFNYELFETFRELSEKYEISVLYMSGNKYSLNIKQKKAMSDDINIVYDFLIQEIKKRCESFNIIVNF